MLERGSRQNSCSVLPSCASQYPVIPKLVTFQRVGSFDLKKTFFPKYILNQGIRQAVDPFPSKSLRSDRTLFESPTFGSGSIYEGRSLIGFMSNFGHHLTVLSIEVGHSNYLDWLFLREADFVYTLTRTP